MKDFMEASKDSVSSSLSELKGFDWGEITDLDTIGQWPSAVKFIIGLILFAICMGAGIYFHVNNLRSDLASVAATEATLRRDFESKAILAVNLDLYKIQMQEMEAAFDELLGQLPADTEVPGLLEDITYTGIGSGLEFSTIQPGNEVQREFYIELPINMTFSGTYHDFGTFVSGIASLDRIVTLHDFNVNGGDRGRLNMSITARTYRYNDATE